MNTWSRKIWAITAMAALGCLLTIVQAGAWNQADLDMLLETNACSGCNLSGANLTGANLLAAQLPGANLSGANLTNANLTWATWTTEGRQCAEVSIGECK